MPGGQRPAPRGIGRRDALGTAALPPVRVVSARLSSQALGVQTVEAGMTTMAGRPSVSRGYTGAVGRKTVNVRRPLTGGSPGYTMSLVYAS